MPKPVFDSDLTNILGERPDHFPVGTVFSYTKERVANEDDVRRAYRNGIRMGRYESIKYKAYFVIIKVRDGEYTVRASTSTGRPFKHGFTMWSRQPAKHMGCKHLGFRSFHGENVKYALHKLGDGNVLPQAYDESKRSLRNLKLRVAGTRRKIERLKEELEDMEFQLRRTAR